MNNGEETKFYTFNMKDSAGREVTISFDDTDMTLSEILEQVRKFLAACDYHFESNEVITVDEERDWSTAFEERIPFTVRGFDTPAPTEWQSNSWVEYDDKGVAREYTSAPDYKFVKPEDC